MSLSKKDLFKILSPNRDILNFDKKLKKAKDKELLGSLKIKNFKILYILAR